MKEVVVARALTKKPLAAAVADDLRDRSEKRSKQYIVRALGIAAAVTFDASEERLVKAAAARRGLSIEDLIGKTIEDNAASSKSRHEDTDALIVRTVAELAAPRKRKKKRGTR